MDTVEARRVENARSIKQVNWGSKVVDLPAKTIRRSKTGSKTGRMNVLIAHHRTYGLNLQCELAGTCPRQLPRRYCLLQSEIILESSREVAAKLAVS